ncbi:uncharacterized protein LOC132189776 isoform X2 [Corylus avellana]|uniref:uncharacterized protein LOC132189776 isoform X2 n=1 Tax=Corylus avellana TaxID=13451 RepID=UPI00286B8AF0|nr:uncharacterized protein LOC132189776 isoform X2 [Corylus avellana]
MDRSEPALMPEWLKSSGSVTGAGSTNHQFSSSSLHSDQSTSSYFRQSSSNNGSARSRPYSTFGRSHRDRDWEDIHSYCDKDKLILGDHRRPEYADSLGSILPNRFEKDMLRGSQSMITGKHGDTWPSRVAVDSNSTKKKHSNDNGLLGRGSVVSSTTKTAFDRDFPSLIAEEREDGSEIGRIPSSGMNTAIQKLRIGTSSAIGGDGWKSVLVEVPVIAGSNSTGAALAQQTISASSTSGSPSRGTGLNMAETLAQGPARARTPPQLSVATQRLEDLAMKQSRQLIPMMPSLQKPLVPSPSEKSKPKIAQQQHTFSSSHTVNYTSRGGSTKFDITKVSVGNLCVLNPSRELKCFSSTANGSRVVNSPPGVAPSATVSVPPRNLSSNLSPTSADCRLTAFQTTVEKKPLSQAQSRNDFFKKLSRKNSLTNPPSAVPDTGRAVSVLKNSDKLVIETATPTSVKLQSRDVISSDNSVAGLLSESRVEMSCNGYPRDVSQKCLSNGEEHSSPHVILYPDEEEAAFLRSLGWDENAGEDEGLTEEEISGFYMENMKLQPTSKLLQGMQPKISLAP